MFAWFKVLPVGLVPFCWLQWIFPVWNLGINRSTDPIWPSYKASWCQSLFKLKCHPTSQVVGYSTTKWIEEVRFCEEEESEERKRVKRGKCMSSVEVNIILAREQRYWLSFLEQHYCIDLGIGEGELSLNRKLMWFDMIAYINERRRSRHLSTNLYLCMTILSTKTQIGRNQVSFKLTKSKSSLNS